MLDTLIAVIVRSVLCHRWGWTAALLLLGGAAAWQAGRLTLRLDAADVAFDTSDLASSSVDPVIRRWDARDRLVVLLRGPRSIPSNGAGAIFTALAERLRDVPGVERVEFRVTPEFTHFLERELPALLPLYLDRATLEEASRRLSREGMEQALLHPAPVGSVNKPGERLRRLRDPLGVVGLVSSALRPDAGAAGLGLTDGYFALPGGRGYVMTVDLAPERDMAGARRLVHTIEAAAAEAASDSVLRGTLRDSELLVLGRRASAVHAFDLVYQDLRRILLAATLVVPLLLALCFRRAAAPLVLLLPVGFGLLLTMGLAGLTLQTVSLVSWIFIVFLVGLGVDFGIHILGHYWQDVSPQPDRAALTRAALRPGRGIVFGALTSAAAFFALQVVDVPVMREIAWLTGAGLLAVLFASFTLLPLVLSAMSPPPARPPTSGGARWQALLGRGESRLGWRSAAPWVVLLVGSVLALPWLRFQTDPDRLLAQADPGRPVVEWLGRVTGTSLTPVLVLSRGGTAEQALTLDRRVAHRLGGLPAHAGVASVVSPSRWWPAPAEQEASLQFLREHPDALAPDRIRRDFAATVARMEDPDPYLTREYLPRITRYLGKPPSPVSVDGLRRSGIRAELERQLVEVEGEFLAVAEVYLRPASSPAAAATRFLAAAATAGLVDLPGVEIVGRALKSAAYRATVRRNALQAVLLASLLVIALLWLQFRSVQLVGLCLVPLLAGLGVSLLGMILIGAELNTMTLAIAPILIGVGLDDGIHIVERLRAGCPPAAALREVGPCLAMTTLTTVAAFACLGLARVDAVRVLGLIGGAGLAVCLAGAVHLVPRLWCRIHQASAAGTAAPALASRLGVR
jgi:predicted exporter